ncbi:MAG: outer membrane protein assembly factor BamA [Gammaproteobacteria bacterium]|nr:outer membrane protein assembly factor BamA [Gammaproteobacteria bacterium]
MKSRCTSASRKSPELSWSKALPMRRLRLVLLLAFCWVSTYTSANYSFEISDIRVQGLLRVTPGTVFNAMSIDIGDVATPQSIRATIRELFKTGYFRDVAINRDGDILLVEVSERPSIVSIEISGNKAVPTEALLEGLAAEGLKEGEIFKQATLDRVRIELIRQYVAQGQYTANIETDIDVLARNRVSIEIEVEEGKRATIVQIAFVGNEVFSTKTLLEQMELKQPTLFGFISGENRYSREKLQGDLESIEAFYTDRGYIEFKINSTQVSMTPDRKQVYLTINISEGAKHLINKVELVGDLSDVDPKAIEELIVVSEGQLYSSALLTATEELVTRQLGRYGYTFATATAVTDVQEDGLVDIKFMVNTGKRAYVRRMNFTGNTTTRDTVLRREMRQLEGAWASIDLIDLSKVRLERLGFFSDVTVETPEVAGEDGLIDVDIQVQEQSTGAITGSLGYQKLSGVILGASVQKANIAGTGKNIGFSLNWSDYRKSVSYTYINPYFTKEGVSRGLSVFLRDTDYSTLNLNAFSTSAIGAGARFGFPIGETKRLQFAGRIEFTDVENSGAEATEIQDFISSSGTDFLNYKVEGLWSRDTRNRAVFATRGSRQTTALEVSVPGSDLEFYRANVQLEQYFPVPWLDSNYAIRLNADLGFGGAYGETEVYPFYEHFYAGGFGSIRGYKRSTLGPRSTTLQNFGSNVPGRPFGGNVLTELSAEFIFPLPFMKNKAQVRSLYYIDAGNVFSDHCSETSVNCFAPSFSELRGSTGVAVSWLTRMGPMSFSLGVPFNDTEFDETEIFSFEVGQTF